jgi:HSP20 family molecular chaperone IbpA
VDGSVPSYPPYNIARTDENAYRISVAVAGFTDPDLSIEAKENMLTIHGEKQTNDEEETGDVLPTRAKFPWARATVAEGRKTGLSSRTRMPPP